jgi:hypothetical protein
MELIDKSAVVMEIEKIYNEDYKFLPSDLVESVQDFKYDLLTALDGLSTVKEVDLEEELSNYIKHYRNKETGYTMLGIAEHFFELGLKAQKEE